VCGFVLYAIRVHTKRSLSSIYFAKKERNNRINRYDDGNDAMVVVMIISHQHQHNIGWTRNTKIIAVGHVLCTAYQKKPNYHIFNVDIFVCLCVCVCVCVCVFVCLLYIILFLIDCARSASLLTVTLASGSSSYLLFSFGFIFSAVYLL
jgi:hypothetical protein